MPFGAPGSGEHGTYFIGYARTPQVTEQMLVNMFVGRAGGHVRPAARREQGGHRLPVLRAAGEHARGNGRLIPRKRLPWGPPPATLDMVATSSHYDLLVLGSGPGGQKAAIAAAKLGHRAAVIERRHMVGGVCINTGTIPSKTLREAVLYLTGLNMRELYGQNYRVKDDITVQDLLVADPARHRPRDRGRPQPAVPQPRRPDPRDRAVRRPARRWRCGRTTARSTS